MNPLTCVTVTSWKQWAAGLVGVVADTAKARRTKLNLTAAEVSERTKVGKPLSRAVISDLETGRKRTLEVSELLTLALALEVSPMSLLLPNVLEEVEIFPQMYVGGIDALSWFLGGRDRPLTLPAEPSGDGDLLGGIDQGMQIALNLVRVEQMLEVQRQNLSMAQRAPELLDMSQQLRELEREKVEHAQRQVAILAAERDRLIHAYRTVVEMP